MDLPSKEIPLKKKKYLLRDSDRSGFTFNQSELFYDNGSLVGGDEFDAPPPSNRLYPDEGGVSPGDVRTNYTSYANVNPSIVQTVTTASTININKLVDNAGNYTYIKSIVYVNGSANNINIASNPQISASNNGDFLVVQGAGTSFILSNGRGLRLYTKTIQMNSGTMLNLIYDATNGLWCETSRMEQNFSLTGQF